jgi:hypothetical protein
VTGFPTGFAGAVFDGRYVYFVPGANPLTQDAGSIVLRYDTTAVFDVPGSWSSFDVGGVNSGAKGFEGATFDGRYVYLTPYNDTNFNTQGYTGVSARYDTHADFGTATSWSTFDVHMLGANAVGYSGAVFDTRYVYFVPLVHSGPNGLVARYDTTGDYASAGSWSTFDLMAFGIAGFGGGVFDGTYVYFVPDYNFGSAGGTVARFGAQGTFTDAGSWTTFDVQGVNAQAHDFSGGVFDGRYVYLVPNNLEFGEMASGLVARYDTTMAFATGSSWDVFDASTVNGRAKGFGSGAFDGRYVYFLPQHWVVLHGRL